MLPDAVCTFAGETIEARRIDNNAIEPLRVLG
jgi:hypothetical protein